VLITGGTGLLGGHIVERMVAQGHNVRALVRKTSDIGHLKTTGAEIVYGNVEDYDSLVAAAQGTDVVIHAAARVLPGWGHWKDFESCIVEGTKNILDASIAAGVKKFVYVSSGTVVGSAAIGVEKPADESAPYLDIEKPLARCFTIVRRPGPSKLSSNTINRARSTLRWSGLVWCTDLAADSLRIAYIATSRCFPCCLEMPWLRRRLCTYMMSRTV
jgi:UDP-glucose 4-epimerase